mmetsp:Transcript_19453/g.27498  ORF Transcript_19453/g.27498 Transcript_19453/m.27498 type:complete len:231 (+) Transcript_19453:190-882(+)
MPGSASRRKISSCSFLLSIASCRAFVLPQSKTAAFAFIGRVHSPSTRVDALPQSSLLPDVGGSDITLGIDLSSQVSDGLRFLVIGLVAIMVIISAISLFVTQSVIPEQMGKLAMLVEQESPERYAEIQSKLADGEKITDRPDLMAELAEVGVDMMKDESEEELQRLLTKVKEKKEKGEDLEIFREPLEATFGTTIEEYVEKVDNNLSSQYLTSAGKELADILRDEFAKES